MVQIIFGFILSEVHTKLSLKHGSDLQLEKIQDYGMKHCLLA
jgi:hypothetical protein